MSVINLSPRNLPEIQKHFESYKLKLQNELTAAFRKRNFIHVEISRLEKELITCNSGIEWCEEVYKAGKKEK